MIPEWQKLIGDGPRAEQYEEWMAQTLESTYTPDDLASLSAEHRARAESRLRISKIIVAAVIETARSESAQGHHASEVLLDISEFSAVAIASLIQLIFEEDVRIGPACTVAEIVRMEIMHHSGVSQ